MSEQITQSPIDWTLPIECRFGQSRDVLQAAERAGFKPVRIGCIDRGYRMEFEPSPVLAHVRGNVIATGQDGRKARNVVAVAASAGSESRGEVIN